ncbi:hypothetical protein ACX80R_18295 [Paeniglutamicibacter antarcticus]|uniref:Uncharacterized protein n=1 Tax=Paeniglutamicibacter antarcticus TaxID=494023 RepID=A0ABP9TUA6_9MICC
MKRLNLSNLPLVCGRYGLGRPYLVKKMTENLDRLFMESIASEENAPKLFELRGDHSYRTMN